MATKNKTRVKNENLEIIWIRFLQSAGEIIEFIFSALTCTLMLDLSQGNAINLTTTWLVLAIAIFLRYVLMAGAFYYLVNIRFATRYQLRKVNLRPGKNHQIQAEIRYSFIASVLFALLGTLAIYSWQKGWTCIYTDLTGWRAWWLLPSLFLVLFIHETYYYWLHRWMHRPEIYRWVHRTHHESLATTAWTSFSFHPVESVLQALPILILIYILPLHPATLIALFLIMSVTSVINHLNYELYPAGTNRHWLGKWWIGATHHGLHHSRFNFNYGLYFTFWDHWMKTESPDFESVFDEKTKTV